MGPIITHFEDVAGNLNIENEISERRSIVWNRYQNLQLRWNFAVVCFRYIT